MGDHCAAVAFLVLSVVTVGIKQVEAGLAHGAGALVAEAVLALSYSFGAVPAGDYFNDD